MKTKLILSSFLFYACTSMFAGVPKNGSALKSKTVTIENSYASVVIGENLNVVFTNDNSSSITLSGSDKFLESVVIKNEKGIMTITNKSYVKGTVYVPAKNMHSLTLKDNAIASSAGFLNCSNLTICLGQDSHIAIKNKGAVNFCATDGTELNFEKYQSISE